MNVAAAVALAVALGSLVPSAVDFPPPPTATNVPREITKFGDRRVDGYYWLRKKDDSAVIEHLQAENVYTGGATARQAAFGERLYQEMLARI